MARKREALRTDGRTDIHGTKTYICLPQGETYNKNVLVDALFKRKNGMKRIYFIFAISWIQHVMYSVQQSWKENLI